jgi:hypothetical protein
VVDTVGLRDDIWVNAAAAMLSRQARVTERWSLLDSGKLQDEIAVYDPLAFKPGAAWKMTRGFRRVTDTNRLVEQNCMENSHDVLDGGAVTTIFKATPKQGKTK